MRDVAYLSTLSQRSPRYDLAYSLPEGDLDALGLGNNCMTKSSCMPGPIQVKTTQDTQTDDASVVAFT